MKPILDDLGFGPVRHYSVPLDGGRSGSWADAMPLGLDATAGEARIARDKTLYRIPVAKRIPAVAKPKWE